MARCRVSFTDSDKTEHAAELEAESLYEAVALAIADFREDPLLRDGSGPMTEFTVAVLRTPHRAQDPAAAGDEVGRALVQTLAELPMMNRCQNLYRWKYCSRAGTLTRRL
jgi:hypothetical protein